MGTIFTFILGLYYPILIFLGVYFLFLALLNIYDMKRNTNHPELKQGPLVSVLVPMRDEEENVNRCLDALRAQNYKNYEILVIDDNSSDGTLTMLNRIAREDPRIRVYRGAPLPEDWYGKPYALQQLAQNAKGEILIFTDADTIHGPSSISWAVTNMEVSNSDFISGYVGQNIQSFGEQITVPLMFFLTGFFIPLFMNRCTKYSFFSTALGQFMAVKRNVFEKIGGFSTVRKKTTEDMYLARHIKAQGFKTMFLDLGDQVQCRMYQGYQAAVEGIGKNIFDFFGKNSLIIFLLILAVTLFLLLPFPLLINSILNGGQQLEVLLAINILYTVSWAALFLDRKIPWYRSFLWPLMYLNLIYMAFFSWFKTISGRGFRWKDRVVS